MQQRAALCAPETRYKSVAVRPVRWAVMAGPRPPPGTHIKGGDTASTGMGEHEMHAEHHRLVNPMENTITADSQLALAA